MNKKTMTHPKERPCPHCKKPAKWDDNPWRPFCSQRCKTIDLGHWAMGTYRIPAEEESDDVNMEIENEKESKNKGKN